MIMVDPVRPSVLATQVTLGGTQAFHLSCEHGVSGANKISNPVPPANSVAPRYYASEHPTVSQALTLGGSPE